jgi:elongation factor Ts
MTDAQTTTTLGGIILEISAAMVKDLREKTGAGVMDCKTALQECQGDFDKAAAHLREKGLAAAAKKASRVANQGVIEAYIHAGGRIGVLVELNCETDFVARLPEFKELAHEIALQIAAMRPLYLSPEDVPAAVIEQETENYRTLIAQESSKPKSPKVVEQIVAGKLQKFYAEFCLLAQPYIRDDSHKLTIKDLITERVAKIGENIKVRRFVRYELGAEMRDEG